ncbi:MAG: hypothetical protein LBT75_01510 [Bacilli bacterium]|jgi:cytochrome bd-type quinol oxidase subunit 2|nr:hypothetical protein [Bacilli bacterium]
MIYGIIVYSIITGLFLLIQNGFKGNKLSKGIKYGLLLSIIWMVYLLEPLPHAKSFLSDNFAYIIADGLSLLILGILASYLLFDTNKTIKKDISFKLNDYFIIIFISIIFVLGRLVLYNFLDIYSCFESNTVITMLWCILVGIVVTTVILILIKKSNLKRGLLIFIINLVLFNGFMVLFFDMSHLPLGWYDLLFRTLIDIISISLGMILSSQMDITKKLKS